MHHKRGGRPIVPVYDLLWYKYLSMLMPPKRSSMSFLTLDTNGHAAGPRLLKMETGLTASRVLPKKRMKRDRFRPACHTMQG
jgi:hypothetical protein